MYAVNISIIIFQRFTYKAKTCYHKNLRLRRSFSKVSKVFEGKKGLWPPSKIKLLQTLFWNYKILFVIFININRSVGDLLLPFCMFGANVSPQTFPVEEPHITSFIRTLVMLAPRVTFHVFFEKNFRFVLSSFSEAVLPTAKKLVLQFLRVFGQVGGQLDRRIKGFVANVFGFSKFV